MQSGGKNGVTIQDLKQIKDQVIKKANNKYPPHTERVAQVTNT